ncbi:MAG: hypothetical protein R3F54_05745 [Alphaproteobacteria bacterium]
MRWGLLLALVASLCAAEANAGSVLIYDGKGKLREVVRPSPSGFIVYDGKGKIVSAVRQTGFARPLIVDAESSGVRVLGTGLSESVTSLRGGVGFE